MAKEYDFSDFDDAQEQVESKPAQASSYDLSDFDDVPSIVEQSVASTSEAIPEAPMSKSLLGGLQMGTSLGFADELAGLSGALGAKSVGDEQAFGDLYKQARDEARQEYEMLRAANPKTFGAAEIAGGLVLPGAGAGAGLGTRLAAGATTGGLAGAGYSEAENLSGLAKDTALGGVLGGSIAGLAPTLARAAGKSASNIKTAPIASGIGAGVGGTAGYILGPEDATLESTALGALGGATLGSQLPKLFPRSKIAFEEALAGRPLMGEQGAARVGQELIDAQAEAENRLSKYMFNVGKEKEALLKEAAKQGKSVDLTGIYQKTLQELESATPQSTAEEAAVKRAKDEVLNLLQKAQESKGDLLIAEQQKQALQRMSRAGQGIDALAFPQSPETSMLYKQTSKNVREALEAPFAQQDQNALKQINERLKAGNVAREDALPSIQETTRAARDFDPAIRAKLQTLEEGLTKLNLEEALPATAEFQPVIPKIKRAAETFDIAKDIGKIKPSPSGAYRALEVSPELLSIGAGKVAKQVIGTLQKAAPEMFTSQAEAALAKGYTRIGNLLNKASKLDPTGRSATLYLISQDPKMRSELEDINK